MIQPFVDAFMAKKETLRARFKAKHPDDYEAIVRAVIELLSDSNDPSRDLDPDRIHEIDDGDYQGTLVYVIGGRGYQPSDYWYVRIDYGSCSFCDTLERIRNMVWDATPTAAQANAYLTLALHIVQRLKKMDGEVVE